jgi:hypothetical protein
LGLGQFRPRTLERSTFVPQLLFPVHFRPLI